MRVSRWRPVCPDCGYALRGLVHPRCPECGVDFPTRLRSSRRWAFRRLAWDRQRRGSLLLSYLRTLAVVLVCPWQAGRRLIIPDGWGRARRWAGAHLVLLAAASAVLGANQSYQYWLKAYPRQAQFHHPARFFAEDTPVDRVLVWFAESFVAWAFVLAGILGIALLLSVLIPGRHRAAKLGGVKFSLYLVPLYLVPLAAWYSYCVAYPLLDPTAASVGLNIKGPMPRAPVDLLAGVFALWWAAGMAGNPYDRSRCLRAFVAYAVLYGVTWLVVTRLLFQHGPLDVML